MPRLLAAALAAMLSVPAFGMAEDSPAEPFWTVREPVVGGVISVPAGIGAGPAPGVVILPDALGLDRRGSRYVHHLTRLGVITLEVETSGFEGAALAAAIHAAVRTFAADPRVAKGQVGLLGFGAGGRAALLLADAGRAVAARVALYPGCIGLAGHLAGPAEPGGSPVLLVHGGRDAANPADACRHVVDTLAAHGRAERLELAGAGYAWDRPSFAGEGPTALPRPDGMGRIPAITHPMLREEAGLLVAEWLADALDAPALTVSAP